MPKIIYQYPKLAINSQELDVTINASPKAKDQFEVLIPIPPSIVSRTIDIDLLVNDTVDSTFATSLEQIVPVSSPFLNAVFDDGSGTKKLYNLTYTVDE